MTDEQIKEKAKRVQRELLDSVLEFFRNNPNKYFGVKKVSDRIGLMEGHQFYFTHGLLTELKKEGKLEQSYGRGFKYKKKDS